MSGLPNLAMDGSAANNAGNTGRSKPSPFSVQSAAGSSGFHHTGLHNKHDYYVPSTTSTYPRNSHEYILPSGSTQQSAGNVLTGRYGYNDVRAIHSQISQGYSYGQSGVTNRADMNVGGSTAYNRSTNTTGGSISSVLPTSSAFYNHGTVPDHGLSSLYGNTGSQIASSMRRPAYNRSTYTTGGPMPSVLSTSAAFGNCGTAPGHGHSPLYGNTGSQIVSSMGIPEYDIRTNTIEYSSPSILPTSATVGDRGAAPPGLGLSALFGNTSSHFSSYSGNVVVSGYNGSSFVGNLSMPDLLPSSNLSSNISSEISSLHVPYEVQQEGSTTTQSIADSASELKNCIYSQEGTAASKGKQTKAPASQQKQEFSFQNDDFPDLSGLKDGTADSSKKFHRLIHHRNRSTQNFSVEEPYGSKSSEAYQWPRPQQYPQCMLAVHDRSDSFVPVSSQGVQDFHGSMSLPPSSSTAHIQGNMPPDNAMTSTNNSTAMPGLASSDEHNLQHQQKSYSLFPRQMPPAGSLSWDHEAESSQATEASAGQYGIMHLLNVINDNQSDQAILALGMDPTTLGLNLNSSDCLYKTFGSPFSDKPALPEPVIPECYSNPAVHIPPLRDNMPPDNAMTSINNSTAMTGLALSDEHNLQHQHQSYSLFHRQMPPAGSSSWDHEAESSKAAEASAGKYRIMHLFNVMNNNQSDQSILARGMDRTTMNLDLNSSDYLYKTLASPFSNKPVVPELVIPQCYFTRFTLDTLFTIFHSKPISKAQEYAAIELCRRGWFYHKVYKRWFYHNVITATFEKAYFMSFNPDTRQYNYHGIFGIRFDEILKTP